jgi:hypothetical protein
VISGESVAIAAGKLALVGGKLRGRGKRLGFGVCVRECVGAGRRDGNGALLNECATCGSFISCEDRGPAVAAFGAEGFLFRLWGGR